MSIFQQNFRFFQMLVCIPWSSRIFLEGLEHLKSKPRGSYTTPKYQKAISLMETISFSSNKKFLPTNKMAPVWAKITTARELLFEKEQTPALRVILRNFVSLPARGRQLGAHSGRPEWILKVLEARRNLQKQKFVIFEISQKCQFLSKNFQCWVASPGHPEFFQRV